MFLGFGIRIIVFCGLSLVRWGWGRFLLMICMPHRLMTYLSNVAGGGHLRRLCSARPCARRPPSAASVDGNASETSCWTTARWGWESRASSGPVGRDDPVAFVVNSGSGTVTPVDLRTRKAGLAIRVGSDPVAIATAAGGRTVYVANAGSGTVTPISVSSLRAGKAIRVGADPRALAVGRGGRVVYMADSGSGMVTPIDTRTGRAGPGIKVGSMPRGLVVAPGGRQVLVLDWGSGRVTPISTADNRAGRAIKVGGYPVAASFAPGGKVAYVG